MSGGAFDYGIVILDKEESVVNVVNLAHWVLNKPQQAVQFAKDLDSLIELWRHSTNIAKENKLKEFILTYNLEAETLD